MALTKIVTVMEARRRRLGITQLDLAEQVGVTQAVISQYERGHLLGIQTATIKKIACILELEDPSDLLKDFIEYELRRQSVGV